MRFSMIMLGSAALLATTPALAQSDTQPAQDNSPQTQSATQSAASSTTSPPKPITLTTSITAVSDYRFRGLTQTDGDAAAQGTININTALGFYVGTFASTIDGSGRTPALKGYGSEEIDLYGGYTKTYHGVGVDVGLLYYYYADRVKGLNTDFFEPYASLSYTLGPVAAKVGGAYAWGGQKGLDFRPNNSDDNLYVYGEASLGIPKTPLSIKGHLGHTSGAEGLVNLVAADDDYFDWSVTGEAVGGPIKVGVSYVSTDISNVGQFAQRLGRGSTVLGYVSLNF